MAVNRYRQLLDWCAEHRPHRILEVGTHRGDRAVTMIEATGRANGTYVGFDLFDDGDADTDKVEHNGKGRSVRRDVEARLMRTGWDFRLVQGNTRETLPAFAEEPDDLPFDLVFIDGGHSVQTIENDWSHTHDLVVDDGAIFLDDYYTGSVDTRRFGCNELVDRLLDDKTWWVTILPITDGMTQMVKVERR